MQVGLCAPSAAAATLAPAAASPSSRYTSPSRPAAVSPSPSKFGPAATPVLDPESIHLVNLHLRAGLATTTSINSSSRGSNLQAANPSSSSEQQQQQQPGKHLVPVTLWPCAKLARGAAVLSPAAWNSLVQPAAGSCLAINEQQYGELLLGNISRYSSVQKYVGTCNTGAGLLVCNHESRVV